MWAWFSSSLFLGWSLGANDAANVFGTAVGSNMVRFTTAACLAVVFIILGGVVNGPAAMATVGELGQIDAVSEAFMASLAAAMAITTMTKAGIPVSSSQALVGALVSYRLIQDGSVGPSSWPLLRMIVLTWAACPLLAAAIAFFIYRILAGALHWLPMPIFMLDRWLRFGLLSAGCYGAWALGGNNMANVVGVYARIELVDPLQIGPWVISQSRWLALLGGLAISAGVITYSRRVMVMVGHNLVELDAISALIAIFAEAVVVDFFAHSWDLGMFILPAVPVSASQALVGGVVGIGLARGVQTIRLQLLWRIGICWIATPLIAAALLLALMPFHFWLA